jgi:predicted TIM-barrel fold metal-dependent hydrolase
MSIEEMDKNGIATAMVSLVQPGPWLGEATEARRLARESNDYAARMASDYPGRFGILAALPLPDSEGSLREIEYSYGTLKADGIAVMTSYGDKWLGDPTFAPVWEELNRRKAVVYTHPLVPECCRNLVPDVTASTIEFATDTTRTIASLLFSGTAARYPDIRFVHSHGGGTTPFLLSRFVRLEAEMKNREQRLPQGVLQELQKFYYDTAQANHPGALSALLRMATTTQVLFGTDYPFRPADEATRGLREFPLRPRYHRAINRENALKLFPRLAAVSGKQS